MNRAAIILLFGWLVFLSSNIAGLAQGTAEISGTVRDQSGAVLPGVEVSAMQIQTGFMRSSVTNETGSYILPNLPVGPYKLEASLPGFRTYVQTGIVLEVNGRSVINVALDVGQVTETVEVQANAAMVETRNVGVGQIMENQRILELPLNGRQVTDLISLSAGVTPAAAGTDRRRTPFTYVAVGVAGGSGVGLTYLLDGAIHNDPNNNLNQAVPFPDALQEFKAEASGLSAQYGMHSAGAINLVTKGGTNQFHGNLFEFVRNYKFNARNFFAATRESLKRNQFGGTFGGPILQNKLFFFAGYQGTIIRSDASDTVGFVPTSAMLTGDFSAAALPACNAGRQVNLAPPFVGNRIDPAQFSKPAMNLVTKIPISSDPCGRILFGIPTFENDHQFVGRMDYQRSTKHSVFGRYVGSTVDAPQPYGNTTTNLLNTTTWGLDSLAQSFAVGDTYLFSPNVVNSLRLVANRTAVHRVPPNFFNWSDLGVGNTYYPARNYKTSFLTVTGRFAVGGVSANNAVFNTTTFGGNDDFSIVRGNHQIMLGLSLADMRSNAKLDRLIQGSFTFNGQVTGLAMADFFLGRASTWSQGDVELRFAQQTYLGLYAQDTWKATPRLTLNYGLRWEPYLPHNNRDGRNYTFSDEAFTNGIKTTRFKSPPSGLIYPGDPGFVGTTGLNKRWNQLAPRVGLAWDPKGDGRMSIRSSFGTFYDFESLAVQQIGATPPPWAALVEIPDAAFENPWAAYPGGSPFPLPSIADAIFSPFSALVTYPVDVKRPTIYQWNLSVQRQIAKDWLISANYLGSNSVHLWVNRELNPARFLGLGSCTMNGATYNTCSTTANTNQRRRLYLQDPTNGRYFGSINQVDDGSNANYQGLLLSAQRRASRGVTINANYTWSHCITEGYDQLFGGAVGYSDPNNRRNDRANCSGTPAEDRRHVFNFSGVAETPNFSNTKLRAVVTGWRVSPIFRISSGPYLTVITGQDFALNGIGNQRPNQILPDVYGDKSLNRYLNPSAFAQPAPGTVGNMGKAGIRGPRTWGFDLALSRIFPFGERQRLEARAEAFNVTNSLRKGNPIVNLTQSNFGQILTAQDPRIMQFALKYFF